ncbi:putative DNA primase [Haemophilus pittmaniae HK 85]|uniref:Putative DNA primase n=1 Tax=Haemophilus pittmaniae HK 85 TaxID=1035188 RepID=F9QCB7_9PAST|nr:putative DNA primase [Haemophilus pittmaniae HK 85]
MDVVALAQFGVDYAVASLGTSTTSEQIQQLFRVTEQVVCCYDGDRAGRDAAWRALENALPYLQDGRQIKFIFLPDGEDPDSYIRQFGQEKFEAYINQAQSLTDFLFAHLSPQVDFSSQEGKTKLIALAAPLIRQIPGDALRMALRNSLAQRVGILDQSQLDELLPKETNAPITKPRMENKIKKHQCGLLFHYYYKIHIWSVEFLLLEYRHYAMKQALNYCSNSVHSAGNGKVFRPDKYWSIFEIASIAPPLKF